MGKVLIKKNNFLKKSNSLKREKKTWGVLFSLIIIIVSCSPKSFERNLIRANEEKEAQNFNSALYFYKKVYDLFPNEEPGLFALKESAKILFFELKDYLRSKEFYQKIVINSNSSDDREMAQKQIIKILFEQLNDYPKAIVEINKLLQMSLDPKERLQYRIYLIRSYYYLNDFFQSENEADEALKWSKELSEVFELKVLKANSIMARKELSSAAKIYQEIIFENPELSRNKYLGLTLALCYEEMKEYKKAIETLQDLRKFHPMPDYIDVRIKRINERMKNQPKQIIKKQKV